MRKRKILNLLLDLSAFAQQISSYFSTVTFGSCSW